MQNKTERFNPFEEANKSRIINVTQTAFRLIEIKDGYLYAWSKWAQPCKGYKRFAAKGLHIPKEVAGSLVEVLRFREYDTSRAALLPVGEKGFIKDAFVASVVSYKLKFALDKGDINLFNLGIEVELIKEK